MGAKRPKSLVTFIQTNKQTNRLTDIADVYGYKRMYTDVYGWIRIYTDVYGCIWMYTDIYGYIWIYTDVYGCIWIYTDVYGCICIYVVFHERKNNDHEFWRKQTFLKHVIIKKINMFLLGFPVKEMNLIFWIIILQSSDQGYCSIG